MIHLSNRKSSCCNSTSPTRPSSSKPSSSNCNSNRSSSKCSSSKSSNSSSSCKACQFLSRQQWWSRRARAQVRIEQMPPSHRILIRKNRVPVEPLLVGKPSRWLKRTFTTRTFLRTLRILLLTLKCCQFISTITSSRGTRFLSTTRNSPRSMTIIKSRRK